MKITHEKLTIKSDIEVAKNVVSDSSGWFSVSYGTCLTSGLFGSRNTDEPYCLDFLGELQAPYGCYNWGITQAVCPLDLFLAQQIN